MRKTWIALTVIFVLLVSFSIALAGSGRVLIVGDKLIFRDGSGNEYVQSPGTTVTAGTVTVSGGSGAPVTTTGTETLTNKTLTSPTITTPTISSPVLTDGTDTQIYVSNSAGEMMPVTMSGSTISNAGVLSPGSNTIGASESNTNTVTLNISAGSTYANASVETGSTFMGWYISNYGAINVTTFSNAPLWSDPIVTVSINAADSSQQTSFKLVFLRP